MQDFVFVAAIGSGENINTLLDIGVLLVDGVSYAPPPPPPPPPSLSLMTFPYEQRGFFEKTLFSSLVRCEWPNNPSIQHHSCGITITMAQNARKILSPLSL